MLNIYDIRLDTSGTNSLSNISGDVIFDANNNGRVVLTTENIKESGDKIYFSDSKKNESTSFFDNIYVRKNDKRLFNENILIVKKNPGDGEFSSIYSAISAVTGNTINNFIKISVGPGEFIEPEIFVPPFVSIIGEGIQDTTIIPSGNHHVFHIQNTNIELSFFGISNASSGYAGIYIDDAGDYSQVHKITFDNCDTNIIVESITKPTFFYGEYIDFNGIYSYGIKVISNNGFEAFTNLENYYNLPSSGSPIGNYISGSNSHVDIYSSGNIGTGTGTAFYLENGADLGMTATNIENWDKGLHIANVGIGCKIFTASLIFENCNDDILIEHPLTTGTINAIAEINKVVNNSPNTLSLLINGTSDGSLTINGTINGLFGNEVTDISTLIVAGSSMGLMYGGVLSSTSGLQLNISAGFGYLTKSDGTLKKVIWTDTLLNITANTQRYIYFNENGILTQNISTPNYIENILLGRVGTTTNSFEFISNNSIDASNIGDRYAKTFINGFGAVYSNGSIISNNITPLHINISAGVYYIGTTENLPSGGNDINFTTYYKNSSGGYVLNNTNVLDNINYNGTNGGLVSIPTNHYVKYSVYTVSDGINEKYFVVYPQAHYSLLFDAQQALLPIPPSYFDNEIVLISSIILQEGNPNIVEIRDNRPILGSIPQGVSASLDHSSLLNLNHDDHLQYLLVSGARNMSGNLGMGGNNINSVSTVNGVTVETHASRHLPNGSDPLTTGTPSSIGTTNQEGIANAFSRQDHVHSIGNNVVTYSKIQTVSGNKILGNTGVAGNVEELALTSGLVFSGNTIGLGNSGVTAGSYNNVTVNNKGIVTSAINKDYTTNQTITVTGDATASGSTGLTLTLATVNSNVGSFNYLTVNGKGLVTSAQNKPYLTGNQTITVTGDVTASGSTGLVTTIANNVVTYSKIQTVSSNKILGNVGITGNVEELETTSGIILSGKTIGLANSGVTAGSFNFVTVNNKGIVTSAINKDYTSNQIITLSGDITGSGSAGLVTTIEANKVTYSKIQTVSGNKILGNTGITGLVEELSLTSGLSLSGNTIGISNNGITNSMIRQSNGVSIIGRSINSTGNIADIIASSDGQVLKRVGGVLGFNSIGINDLPVSGVSVGSFNFVTVNNKGIVTTALNKPYLTGNQTITVTGDATASGSTGLALTLATVNSNIGSFNNITINGKGLATSASNKDYTTNQTITITGDVTGSGSSGIATTLATVNSNIGSFNYVTVNGKGLTTSAQNKPYLTGNQTIIVTGDVTASGSTGLATTIANNAVTYSKIQNITANKILGRVTSSGIIQELALSSGLAFSGASIITTGGGGGGGTITLSGDVTGSGSAGITTTIQPNTVTYSKIQNISGNKILGNTGALGNIEELETTSGISISGRTIFADYTNSPYKNVCRVTTTANLTANYANGVSGVGATLTATTNVVLPAQDGVTLAVGNRILVKNQTTTFNNGIYIVTSLGSAGVSPWVLTRASDSNTPTKIYQAGVTIKEGSTFTSTKWLNSNNTIAITIGTTAITYIIAGGYTISTGLTLTNKTITVATAGITRAMMANSIAVSVIGRTANSTGVPADIAASSNGLVLKRVNNLLGFHGIGNADLNTAVVTYDKIQNITANRILGRITSTGAIQELALSSGLAFSGASLTATGGSSNLTGSTAIVESSWSSNTNYSTTITVTGAAVNDRVVVTITPSLMDTQRTAAGSIDLWGYVNSTNTVTVWGRVNQFLTTTSGTWYVTVLK